MTHVRMSFPLSVSFQHSPPFRPPMLRTVRQHRDVLAGHGARPPNAGINGCSSDLGAVLDILLSARVGRNGWPGSGLDLRCSCLAEISNNPHALSVHRFLPSTHDQATPCKPSQALKRTWDLTLTCRVQLPPQLHPAVPRTLPGWL